MALNIGIDLGTSSVRVFVEGRGIILEEPSLLVYDKTLRQIVAVGKDAEHMIGRTPSNMVTIKPIKNGVISDFNMTERMLRYFINKVNVKKGFMRPVVCVSVPADITELEKRSVEEATLQAGARKAYVIESPIATAVGLGVDINQPIGNMFIDIGGGTTDIAVTSINNIVVGSTIRMAGEQFNMAIQRYIRKKYNLLIGMETAEEIKKEIGAFIKVNNPRSAEVRGRDLNNGLPRTFNISSNDIAESLEEYAYLILNEIHFVLEKTPPELASDITYRGIVLSGGSSLLYGIDKLIENELGISTMVAGDNKGIVANGLGKYLELMHK